VVRTTKIFLNTRRCIYFILLHLRFADGLINVKSHITEINKNTNNFWLKWRFNLSTFKCIPVDFLVKKCMQTYSGFTTMRLHATKPLGWRFCHELHIKNTKVSQNTCYKKSWDVFSRCTNCNDMLPTSTHDHFPGLSLTSQWTPNIYKNFWTWQQCCCPWSLTTNFESLALSKSPWSWQVDSLT